MAVSPEEFVQFTQYLRNAAPQEFDRFRDMFKRYTVEAIDLLLLASGEHLLVAQGRAQQCSKLLQFLEKAK